MPHLRFCAQYGCSDGDTPQAALVQGADGDFHGTTDQGGTDGLGTIFEVTPEGRLTTLQSFDGGDGNYVSQPLVLGTDGNFYGTTVYGGDHGYGTAFKIAPSGALTTLYSFCQKGGCTDGAYPQCALVQGTDGNMGTNLTGATSVTFNGAPATFRVVSKSAISTSVPADAATGTVQVVTPSGTLCSNVPFRVAP